LDIELVFTNITPFHSSAPGGARVTLEGQFVGERQGFPCTRTRFMPVMGGADGEGVPTPVYVPLMPANTLRHVLREALLAPIMEHFRGRYTLSTGSYAAAHAGNASGNPDGVSATYDEIVAVRQHPFLGLFGGGPRMVEGRLRVDAAWPITPVTLPYLGDLEEHAVRGHLTSVQFIRRVDPVVDISDEDLPLIENATTAVTRWHSQFVSGAADEDTRGLRSFSAHEVVIPGVNWLWRIAAHRPTAAQKGLLLLALSTFNQTQIGGMGRLGYGRMRLKSLTVDGRELWDGQGLVDDDDAMSWLQAWADALGSLTSDAFESFAASRRGVATEQAEATEGAA
jgi:CRISPR type IV-associated protein Csf2